MNKPRILLIAPALLLLAACSGTSDSGGSTSSSASTQSEVGSPPFSSRVPNSASGGASDSTGKAGGTGAAARPAPLQRSVISHGSIEMQSRHVAAARDTVLVHLARWDGVVASEQTSSDTHGRMTSSILELRVPSEHFSEAMADLPTIAETLHQERSSEDVTTQVIDVDVRVRAKQRALNRIEALLAQAKSLQEILVIEGDIADRQAELDSLKSQQAYLHDQTSLSTIQVSIVRTPHHVVPVKKHHQDQGLVAGLSTGFGALQRVTVAALTIVGVLAPFALVGALIGVPLWLVWRRRRPAPPAAPAES
jgi:hypothetical protein